MLHAFHTFLTFGVGKERLRSKYDGLCNCCLPLDPDRNRTEPIKTIEANKKKELVYGEFLCFGQFDGGLFIAHGSKSLCWAVLRSDFPDAYAVGICNWCTHHIPFRYDGEASGGPEPDLCNEPPHYFCWDWHHVRPGHWRLSLQTLRLLSALLDYGCSQLCVLCPCQSPSS